VSDRPLASFFETSREHRPMSYDTNDPEVRSRICGLDQHHARFELDGEVAYGIGEPYDTLCYELAKAGRLGFSLLD